jgi:superfamily II DNA or RNA helicase
MSAMNELEQHVGEIKNDLLRRQEQSKVLKNQRLSISKQTLQQFLMDWFKFRKRSRLSDEDKKSLAEIQTYLDKYDILVYSKNHPLDNITIDQLSLHNHIGVRLKYIEKDANIAGKIEVVDGVNTIAPYPFQRDAISKLDRTINNKPDYAGMLVLPTGGGKTVTAVYWLLKNVIDKGGKILWIAHRHTLLDQALKTFMNNAYKKDADKVDVLRNCKEFRYRLISGLHGEAISCQRTDDIIIANKDSLTQGVRKKNGKVLVSPDSGLYYIYNNWLKICDPKGVFLVIDECHHAIGKSYRFITEYLIDNGVSLQILGLTATPTRLSKKEQGLLLKVFPDNFEKNASINDLIAGGFLSHPYVLEEVQTGIDMKKELSEKEIEKVKVNDIESISKKTADKLGDSPDRNRKILNEYLEKKGKYRQTIIFALNVKNAIALNILFNENKISSEYVLSGRFDKRQTITSAQLNREKIEKFKDGKVQILTNYTILTEGIDIPKVQTIFLVRPTLSSVLMTQMIGRGLRGEKVGGTKETYIVPFIDNWHGLISWVSPKQLAETDEEFVDSTVRLNKHIRKIISATISEMFFLTQDNSIDPELIKLLKSWSFVERIPVGLYVISIDKDIPSGSGGKVPFERESTILVYNHLKKAYSDFIAQLPSLFEKKDDTDESLPDDVYENHAEHVESMFFTGLTLKIGYSREDIKDIIRSYNLTDYLPDFLPFTDRNKFDIGKVAEEFYKKGYKGKAYSKRIFKIWDDENIGWKTFLGINEFKYFKEELELALDKKRYPEHYQPSTLKPTIISEKLEYKDMSLEDIKQIDTGYYKFLRDSVLKNYKNRKGYYFQKKPYYSSDKQVQFELTYIVSLSDGGKTEIKNLCLHRRVMNWSAKVSHKNQNK